MDDEVVAEEVKLGADMRGRSWRFGFGDNDGRRMSLLGWVGLRVQVLWEVEARTFEEVAGTKMRGLQLGRTAVGLRVRVFI